MPPISSSLLPLLAAGLFLGGCDAPEPEGAATPPAAPAAPPAAAPAPSGDAPGAPLDSLMRFRVNGLKSAEHAAWLKELFNRQENLKVERISFDDGLIDIRYSSVHTDRDKLVRMIEVNELAVEEALYLNPDPDRSG